MQDIFLYRGPYPPHGIGGKAETAVGIKAFDRLHHAHIAFRDQFGQRQAIAAIAHGNLGHQPQVAGHEAVCSLHILMLLPAFGEHELFLRLEHREFADICEIAGKVTFCRQNRHIYSTHLSKAPYRLNWFVLVAIA